MAQLQMPDFSLVIKQPMAVKINHHSVTHDAHEGSEGTVTIAVHFICFTCNLL